MSTYASSADVANYIEGWVTDDPFALERLIQRCERDIDRLLRPLNFALPPTQVISIVGASAGTFSVQWNGTHPAATPNEVYNVSGAQLQSDLQALTDIGSGNVTIVGDNPYTLVWTYAWATQYQDFNIPTVTVNSNLTPGSSFAAVQVVEGLKINPLVDLNANQRIALSRAICAQVEYRNTMGERFFVRAQYESVKGPDFTTTGRMPLIAPKAKRELAQTGLLFMSTRAVASYRRYGTARGNPTY